MAARTTMPAVIETVEQLTFSIKLAAESGRLLVLVGRDNSIHVSGGAGPQAHPDAYSWMIGRGAPYTVYRPATEPVRAADLAVPNPVSDPWAATRRG